jgi:hypothetical protein
LRQAKAKAKAKANLIGNAFAARGMDTRRLQHVLGHASITKTVRDTAMSPSHFLPDKSAWQLAGGCFSWGLTIIGVGYLIARGF